VRAVFCAAGVDPAPTSKTIRNSGRLTSGGVLEVGGETHLSLRNKGTALAWQVFSGAPGMIFSKTQSWWTGCFL